jgi:hypothetical protein
MRDLYLKIFAFLFLMAVVSSCKLEGDVLPPGATATGTNPGTDPTTITGEYYFKGTLNGQNLTWQTTDGVKGWVIGSAAATSNNAGDITGSLSALISQAQTLNPQIGVEFGTYHVLPTDDKKAIFNDFIKTGILAFGTDHNAIDAKFINISYTDSQGNFYTSATGAQTGSTANIISVTPMPATLGSGATLKIKLTFNCKLYSIDASTPALTLTNAEATVSLENLL